MQKHQGKSHSGTIVAEFWSSLLISSSYSIKDFVWPRETRVSREFCDYPRIYFGKWWERNRKCLRMKSLGSIMLKVHSENKSEQGKKAL